MVQRIGFFIELAVQRHRIVGMRQRGAHAAGRVEQPRQAHCAQRIEAVGVLHDLRFDGLRPDAGREGMAFDRMGDGGQLVRRKVQRRQLAAGQQRGLARSQMALGCVLGKVDQVVQVAGRQHHQRVGVRIIVQQQGGVAPDAMQVVGVVCAVVSHCGAG